MKHQKSHYTQRDIYAVMAAETANTTPKLNRFFLITEEELLADAVLIMKGGRKVNALTMEPVHV